jgi:hypothetical protein|tara:strand:- start:977 stop:1162 length:186 start_codon:yes stop_codon:yes gene_type:complete
MKMKFHSSTEKLIKETLTIAAQLVTKAENKKAKLTRRMLIDDLKMIKLNLMLIQDEDGSKR